MSRDAVELAVVGGGAAGLFAAAAAHARRIPCLVIERKARIGSKMLMTANGRCNFTKDIPAERMLADIGEPVASFARHALSACPPSMILGGFRARGLKTKRMADGRLFPASEKAADVVHVFGDLLRDGEIPLLTNCSVTGIHRSGQGFAVAAKGFSIAARNVLAATGGLSFPKTGSTGDGQEFARSLGLRVEPCRAGLTGFEAGGSAFEAALRACRSGAAAPARAASSRFPLASVARAQTAVATGEASIVADGGTVCRYTGEIEFEPWGFSGAAVYNCQRVVARRNIRDFTLRLAIGREVFDFRRPSPRPLKESIVTIGGVALDEVDPRTMEARKVPGLYFAGEVLDIDGPTGGYNLSLAFATARLAVESIARRASAGR